MSLSVRSWCRVCGTQHEDDACPGEVLATGPERHGFRLLAETPRGPEVYGTLVAPSGRRRWRARILTFPNVLWVIPRGGTMKFTADTAAQVESKAVAFIRDHCERRGFTMRTEVPSVESREVDREQDSRTARSKAFEASQRQLGSIRIRFGARRPDRDAATDDLSEGGLFIRTDAPLPAGSSIQMHLEVEGFGFPLSGSVRWVRDREETGRPRGMGIRLDHPHPRYLHYIRQKRKRPVVEESATYEVQEWESAGEIEEFEPAGEIEEFEPAGPIEKVGIAAGHETAGEIEVRFDDDAAGDTFPLELDLVPLPILEVEEGSADPAGDGRKPPATDENG